MDGRWMGEGWEIEMRSDWPAAGAPPRRGCDETEAEAVRSRAGRTSAISRAPLANPWPGPFPGTAGGFHGFFFFLSLAVVMRGRRGRRGRREGGN